jgi:hypothetical protein
MARKPSISHFSLKARNGSSHTVEFDPFITSQFASRN